MDTLFISDTLDKLSDFFSFRERTVKYKKDMEEKGSASIKIGYYHIDQTLKRCYEFLQEGKPEMVFVQIVNDLSTFLEALNTFKIKHIKNKEPDQFKLHQLLYSIYLNYNNYAEDFISHNIAKFSKSWLFTQEELNNRIIFDPRRMVYVENSIKQSLFKIYSYREGTGSLNSYTKYRIYPQIGISQSLEEWFSFLNKQTIDPESDTAIVTLFMKLDYVSDHFASFVISIHQKDSIWIASDQLDFDNPRNKNSRRKPERDREKHYENVSLPYEICDELDELRSKNNSLVSENSFERIKISLEVESNFIQTVINEEIAEGKRIAKDLDQTYQHWSESVFSSRNNKVSNGAIIVAKRILREKNIPFKHIKESLFNDRNAIASTFYIEGRSVATITYKDESEIILTIYKRAEILQKPLVDIHTYDRMYLILLIERFFEELNFDPQREQVMLSNDYMNQKLISGAEFHSNEDGFSYYDESAQTVIQESIEAAGTKDTSITKFSYHLAINSPHYEANWLGTPKALDNLVKWTILEDQAQLIKSKIKNEIEPRRVIDSEKLEKLIINNSSELYKIAFTWQDDFLIKTFSSWSKIPSASKIHFISKNKDGLKSNWGDINIPGSQYKIPRCQICKNNNVYKKDPLVSFRINHYSQLCLLAGIKDKKDLPRYFQAYRSHKMRPYMGNSILDNVHPYLLIRDPASERHPNGMNINLFMCRACYKKMSTKFEKEFAENKKHVILYISEKTNLILEDYQEYIEGVIEKYMVSNYINEYIQISDKKQLMDIVRIINRIKK